METVIHTDRVSETEACGARLAEALRKDPGLPRFVALYGDLGVGKTAFIRGFASVAAPGAAVRSPTFARVNVPGCVGAYFLHTQTENA